MHRGQGQSLIPVSQAVANSHGSDDEHDEYASGEEDRTGKRPGAAQPTTLGTGWFGRQHIVPSRLGRLD
jgi:hypothetical protein